MKPPTAWQGQKGFPVRVEDAYQFFLRYGPKTLLSIFALVFTYFVAITNIPRHPLHPTSFARISFYFLGPGLILWLAYRWFRLPQNYRERRLKDWRSHLYLDRVLLIILWIYLVPVRNDWVVSPFIAGATITAVLVWLIFFQIPHLWRNRDQSTPHLPERLPQEDIDRAMNWWKESKTEQPVSNNFGSARWASHRLEPYGPTDLRGVMFGKSSEPSLPFDYPGAPIASRPEAHTLIVARTRAGKGTRVIVPTLLRYDESMLVIDPKGENAAITARQRRDQLRQTVHIVNPWGEMEGLYKDLGFSPATFNPLDAIDPKDPNAVSVAQTLAATMCPVSNEKDRFWQGSAANVLTGVLLWLADRPDQQKTLARAREIVTQSRTNFQKTLVQMVTSTAFHGAISEMVGQYIDLAAETYSGIMANLAESTKFLSDPRIKASTESSTFSMQTLRDELTTIYLVIPHDRIQTHSTWLRLTIASAMQALKNRSRIRTPPNYRCMFMIDEFGSIGHIADIPRDIALMSGYGLDFCLIVQGLDQLKTHYGEAKSTILNNCAYKWFCNISDLDTAKYLSESLGKKTIRTKGSSTSKGQSDKAGESAPDGTTIRPGSSTETEGESTSFGETGRPLLTPDEILNLGRGTAILLNPLGSPHYLHPIDYWNLQDTFDRLKYEHPQFYWKPPLRYDRNPYIAK